MNTIMITICICCLVTIITALSVKAYKNNPKRLRRLLAYANKYYVAHSNEAYKLKNKLHKTDEDITKHAFHDYCAKMAGEKIKALDFKLHGNKLKKAE